MAGADNFDEGVLTLTHNWAVLVEAFYHVFQFDQEILTKKSFFLKKRKSAIFVQMGHRQATTSRQKRKTKLHSVPRGKADDHERSFKEHS